MKTTKLIPLLFTCLLLCTTLFSQAIPEDDIPLDLVGSHYSQFPNAKSTTWEEQFSNGSQSMRVSFVYEKQDYIVKYDMNGLKFEEQVSINKNELYPGILTDLELKYGKYKILSLMKNSILENGITKNEFYILSLKSKSGLMDEFLSKSMELIAETDPLLASIKN